MSIDPTSKITNHINPTHHMNNNGGGLGGGSASSYKNDQNEQSSIKEESLVDEFTPSASLQNETGDEIANKSLWVLFKEFISSIFDNILSLFKLNK